MRSISSFLFGILCCYLFVTLSAFFLILISVWHQRLGNNDQLIIKPSYYKKVIWQHVKSSLSKNNATKRFLFTYEDPKNYRGPIVEGWPPDKNRSLPLYVKPQEQNYLLKPFVEKLNCLILIVVHSHPDHFKERLGIRNTYGKPDGKNQTCVIFLLGTTTNSFRNVGKLAKEQDHFKDLLQADFVDHYNNLTLKTMFTLKFFSNVNNFQGVVPEYLFKADQDSYLNLPSLWRTLYNSTSKASSGDNLLMGAKFSAAQPRFPKSNKRFTEKWICPQYMYNGQGYPPMLSGSGYVMSRSTAYCLYSEALKLPFFHLEDVLVTGFAGEACGIQRRHHNGFRHLPVKLHRIKSTDLMLHYLNFKAKANLFKARILK